MIIIELTEEEFRLVCIAVDASCDVMRGAADNAPNDEDAMIDSAEYLRYRALQHKFPPPGPIGMND